MAFASTFGLTAAALALEAIFGYPAFLLRAIGHPIVWIGALIGATESQLNRQSSNAQIQKLSGVVALAFWLICVGICGGVVTRLLGRSLFGELVLALWRQACWRNALSTIMYAPSLRPWSTRGLNRHARRSAGSLAAMRRTSMKLVLPEPPLKVLPRIFQMASSRRRSGSLSAVSLARCSTRLSTRLTAWSGIAHRAS